VRFAELVKLASLLQRRDNEPVAEALEDINARLGAALTPLQREVLQSSPLDEELLGSASQTRARAAATAAREEPSLAAFLPRRGDGLVLSAPDVESYITCPLRYKFARVLRIRASRHSTSASGSSSTRCSSASTSQAAAAPRR